MDLTLTPGPGSPSFGGREPALDPGLPITLGRLLDLLKRLPDPMNTREQGILVLSPGDESACGLLLLFLFCLHLFWATQALLSTGTARQVVARSGAGLLGGKAVPEAVCFSRPVLL